MRRQVDLLTLSSAFLHSLFLHMELEAVAERRAVPLPGPSTLNGRRDFDGQTMRG